MPSSEDEDYEEILESDDEYMDEDGPPKPNFPMEVGFEWVEDRSCGTGEDPTMEDVIENKMELWKLIKEPASLVRGLVILGWGMDSYTNYMIEGVQSDETREFVDFIVHVTRYICDTLDVLNLPMRARKTVVRFVRRVLLFWYANIAAATDAFPDIGPANVLGRILLSENNQLESKESIAYIIHSSLDLEVLQYELDSPLGLFEGVSARFQSELHNLESPFALPNLYELVQVYTWFLPVWKENEYLRFFDLLKQLYTFLADASDDVLRDHLIPKDPRVTGLHATYMLLIEAACSISLKAFGAHLIFHGNALLGLAVREYKFYSHMALRLMGMQDFKRIIDMLSSRHVALTKKRELSRWVHRAGVCASSGETKTMVSILRHVSSLLLNTLKSEEIVKSLFGTNLHVELVSRSLEVLSFMARCDALGVEDMDIIWGALIQPNQHHSVREALWTLLERLVMSLADDLRSHLASKVSEYLRQPGVGVADGNALKLLDSCTHVAMGKGSQSDSVSAGISVLYGLFKSTPSAQCGAIWDRLTTQIARASDDNIRDILMARVLSDLARREQSTTPVLHTLAHILTLERQRELQNATIQESYTDRLCETHGLVGLLFEDIAHRKKLAYLESLGNELDLNNYLAELKIRLEFTAKFSTYGMKARDLFLCTEVIHFIWRLLVVGAIAPPERELAFAHLRRFGMASHLSSGGGEMVNVAEYVCTVLVPEIPVQAFGLQALGLIQDAVKCQISKLAKPILPGNLQMLTPLLWTLAMNSGDELVGIDALTCLVDLYMSNGTEELMAELVENIFSRMLASVRELAAGGSGLALSRSIAALQAFLDRAALFDFGPEPADEDVRSSIKIRAQINIDKQEAILKEFTCSAASTIRQVIAKVARIASTSSKTVPHTVRVLRGGKELTDMKEFTLSTVAPGPVESISFMILTDSNNSQNSGLGEPKLYPQSVLNVILPVHDILFLLLGLSEPYASMIWKVLLSLPEVPIPGESMDNAGNLDVNRLLDPTNSYQLLYRLRRVHGLLTVSPQWRDLFLRSGGFRGVLAVFVAKDLGTFLDRQSLRLLLRIRSSLGASLELSNTVSLTEIMHKAVQCLSSTDMCSDSGTLLSSLQLLLDVAPMTNETALCFQNYLKVVNNNPILATVASPTLGSKEREDSGLFKQLIYVLPQMISDAAFLFLFSGHALPLFLSLDWKRLVDAQEQVCICACWNTVDNYEGIFTVK
ncbi:hypothetical protein HDU93_006725 [Gonapodya sp. JEL0774]|nr:hypothetical protein HDU93_006725 [Gonapodya sp. JEL0774]